MEQNIKQLLIGQLNMLQEIISASTASSNDEN